MRKIFKNLTFQVIVAIILGVIVGVIAPSFAPTAKVISKTFINMISMLIIPIIFLTIVLGISKMGDMKKVGRVGGKALLYFEIITTIAIIIGLVAANLIRPGDGLNPLINHPKVPPTTATAAATSWVDFLSHIITGNIFESFAKGDILQVLFFAAVGI